MKKTSVQAGLKLQIDNEVTRSIRQHARAHMKTEVCGVLIGDDVKGTTEIRAHIEALSATQAGTHVTFTQDAWEEIYRVKDATYPDARIVGWYHSHPGFGVFLSEHDTFIHRNFFSAPNQVAWVYDPHTDEEGCFGWFNGRIERIATISMVDLNDSNEERTPKEPVFKERSLAEAGESDLFDPATRSNASDKSGRKPFPAWARIAIGVASYLSVAVSGFMLALFLLPPHYLAVTIDPRTGRDIGVLIDPHTGEPVRDSDGRLAAVPLHLEQFPQLRLESPVPPASLTAPPPAPPPPPGGSK